MLHTSFEEAYRSGKVCLHPTDSLPGLTFDPALEGGFSCLKGIKGPRIGKSFVSLAASYEKALSFWQPLPGPWPGLLSKVWPGPLSVIWLASEKVCPTLVAPDGSLCLRVPSLSQKVSFFHDFLLASEQPVPSTSVNKEGMPSATSWKEAVSFLEGTGAYVPPIDDAPSLAAPSTVIKIASDGGYTVIREGAIKREALEAYFDF